MKNNGTEAFLSEETNEKEIAKILKESQEALADAAWETVDKLGDGNLPFPNAQNVIVSENSEEDGDFSENELGSLVNEDEHA